MAVLDIKETRVNIFETEADVVQALADRFCDLAKECISARNGFFVSLSGGNTPRALYELLAQPEFSQRVDWSKVILFLGDERCVAPDHQDSNFGMIKKALIAKVNIPTGNVLATEGQDKDPEGSAKTYEESIRKAFAKYDGVPQFDLMLLGLGPDGHTASLFPNSPALAQKEKLFVANYVQQFQASRLTMTLPVINNSRNIFFLVAGSAKASIVGDIFRSQTKKYPAQLVQPQSGKLEWYMDRAAATNLSGG
jgi:6-phosphogluconolactonase